MRSCAAEQGRVSVLGSVYITGSIMAAGKIGTKIDKSGKTFLFRKLHSTRLVVLFENEYFF